MLLISICDKPNSTWKAPYSGYKQGSKSTQSAKICPKSVFSGGGGGGLGVPDQLNPKCQDLSKSAWGGGGVQTNTNIYEILEWGHSRNFEPKFSTTGASYCITDISHTLSKQVA